MKLTQSELVELIKGGGSVVDDIVGNLSNSTKYAIYQDIVNNVGLDNINSSWREEIDNPDAMIESLVSTWLFDTMYSRMIHPHDMEGSE